MRKSWWIGAAVALAGITTLAYWQWPHWQLTRAEQALIHCTAPSSLYWPRQSTPFLNPVDRATALAKAGRAIESAEARLGPTGESVYLKGRIASARGNHAEAIRLIYLATLLAPDNATYQTAYGVSIAIRAAAENRAIDWATAANALLTASEMKGFYALGYADLARVSEMLPAPHAAIEYWKKAGPNFAPQLKHAEDELQARKTRIKQVIEQRTPSRDLPGSAELLLQLALSEWLPERSNAADLHRLAQHWRTQMNDPVLADLLAKPANPAADLALARSTHANSVGQYRIAADAALEAARLYTRAGNLAGQALAGAQASFGLRRSNRPAECLVVAAETERIALAHGYRWAGLRSQQEAIACKSRQRVIDLLAERAAVADRSIGSGLLDLEFRGASSLIEPSRGFTAPVESWDRGQRGLLAYWGSVMPAPFATNFYSPLGLMAESFGYSRLAALLFREEMAIMEGHPNQWLRAAIRSDFFRLDPTAKLPGETTSEIEAASQDLAAGHTAEALARLKRVVKGSGLPYPQLEHYDRITLLPVMGRALWQQGNRDDALRHYRALIDDNVRYVSALKGRRQRQASILEIGPAWRLLAEAQLDTEGGSAALRTWQTFRTLANPGHPVDLTPPAGEVRLALALLPTGPVVWWADTKGIAVHRVPQKDLTRRAQRFAALVANPGSPINVVNDSGRELYDLLIAPFEPRLLAAKTLVVDADGPLALLPWAALRDSANRPLLARIAIVQSIGWGAAPPASTDWQPALVVAEPAVAPHDRPRFPVLAAARQEAEHLRTLFPNNLYLAGADARVETLQQQLTQHKLFHFAGHGVANGGNGALVLAGEPTIGTRLITAAEIADLDLHQLRLATLAACSSGSGEDRGAVNVESLVQAFLDAGTRQVLASRWNVDSHATSLVMQQFYQRLQQGARPEAALREASLAIQSQQPHPYYWAAFQLFGLP